MIRVNLAKARPASIPSQSLEDAVSEEQLVFQDQRRGLVVRLVIIGLFPLGLFLYEDMIIPEKQAVIQRLSLELDEVTRKNQDAAASVDEIKKFEKDQEKLQAQINTLEGLRKDRIKEVRVLDYIQREIPNRVWLTQLELNEDRLQISGIATADMELTTFMDSLQRSAYLSEVNLVRSNEGTHPEYGTVKKFDITCQLERAP